MTPRTPPHDIEAEKAVLGAMLQNSAIIDDVVLQLHHQDFYVQRHQLLYQAILRLAERTSIDSIDLVTLSQHLAAVKQDADVGGWAYLSEIYTSTPSAANAPRYAAIVKDLSIRRQLILAAETIQREAYDPSDPEMLLDSCEKAIFGIRETRKSTIKTLQDCSAEVLDRVDRVSGGEEIGVKTGLLDLDGLILLKPQELTIVAARPSVGKSILGHQVAMHLAYQALGVFFASVEMPGVDIAARILSSTGNIDSTVTAGRRQPNAQEAEKLTDAYASLNGLKFWIDDSPEQSVKDIAANARRLHRQHQLSLIVVDYLQLLQTERHKGQTRAESLGEVSRGLKRLARELKVSVLALAQLNRDADGEPELHHIRESGDIEQDADIVLMPWQAKDYQGTRLIHIKVAKHRNGPTGSVTVFHRREMVRFDHHAAGLQPHPQPLFGDTK